MNKDEEKISEIAQIIGCEAKIEHGSFSWFVDNPRELAEKIFKMLTPEYPYELIIDERTKQDLKWGEQNHDEMKWLTILIEEVGEIGKAVNELYPSIGSALPKKKALLEDLRKELIQTAAVCVAWLEYFKRGS